jgi:hypothetical protein
MSIRRRRKDKAQRPYRKYDFLAEVESDRLQYIGAITLAWNWIEGAIDGCLGVALDLHPDMWVEVTSRINGMDGKFEILRRSLTLDGYIRPPEDVSLQIRKTINAIENYKKLRDGIIHVRLVHPDAIIADTVQRKGITDEMLVSDMALLGLYNHLEHLAEEADWLVRIFYYRWCLSEKSQEDERPQLEDNLRSCVALHRQYQTTREGLPPLPEFPEEPPTPPNSEGEPQPRG